jgi:hypothetical protein
MWTGLWFSATVAATLILRPVAWARVQEPYPFSDVPPHHWAYDNLAEVAALGYFNGYPDGTFRGKYALTRYAFAVALHRTLMDFVRAFDYFPGAVPPREQSPASSLDSIMDWQASSCDLDLQASSEGADRLQAAYRLQHAVIIAPEAGGLFQGIWTPLDAQAPCPFADVPDDHWAHDVIADLSAAGVLRGYPGGTFQGNRPVTRSEAAVALQRYLQWVRRRNPQPSVWPPKPLAPPLLTGTSKAPWAASAIAELGAWGFWRGYLGGGFAGHRHMTRYEVVVVLVRTAAFQHEAARLATRETIRQLRERYPGYNPRLPFARP